MASVQASVVSHRPNHLIITSHHQGASIHQPKLTNKQIQRMAKRRGQEATPRHHPAGQTDCQPTSPGGHIISRGHTAPPRLVSPARRHARTRALTKRIRFHGWTHIYIYIYVHVCEDVRVFAARVWVLAKAGDSPFTKVCEGNLGKPAQVGGCPSGIHFINGLLSRHLAIHVF